MSDCKRSSGGFESFSFPGNEFSRLTCTFWKTRRCLGSTKYLINRFLLPTLLYEKILLIVNTNSDKITTPTITSFEIMLVDY